MSRSIPSSRRRPRFRYPLGALCLGVLGVGSGCNVYTPDMLVGAAGAGGVGSSGTNGGMSTGGLSSGGVSFGGGSGSTIIAGASNGGTNPIEVGGAAGGGTGGIAGTVPSTGGTISTGGGANGGGAGVPSGGTAGQSSTAGDGGTAGHGGVVATGGKSFVGGAGGAPGVGGTIATGGTSITGGTSAAGGSVSTGGAPACDSAILDDMRDSGAAIFNCNGRNGTWYTFGTDALLSPSPLDQFKKVAVSAADEAILSAKYVAKLQGGQPQSDCGMGFTLRVQNDGTKIPYSLAGARIVFKYRTTGIGTGVLSLAIPLQTTIPKSEGGSCDLPCYNHYFYRLQPSGSLNGGWQTMDIPLVAAADPGFAQNPYWGANRVAWEPALAMMIQFTVSSAQTTAYSLEVGPLRLVP